MEGYLVVVLDRRVLAVRRLDPPPAEREHGIHLRGEARTQGEGGGKGKEWVRCCIVQETYASMLVCVLNNIYTHTHTHSHEANHVFTSSYDATIGPAGDLCTWW